MWKCLAICSQEDKNWGNNILDADTADIMTKYLKRASQSRLSLQDIPRLLPVKRALDIANNILGEHDEPETAIPTFMRGFSHVQVIDGTNASIYETLKARTVTGVLKDMLGWTKEKLCGNTSFVKCLKTGERTLCQENENRNTHQCTRQK